MGEFKSRLSDRRNSSAASLIISVFFVLGAGIVLFFALPATTTRTVTSRGSLPATTRAAEGGAPMVSAPVPTAQPSATTSPTGSPTLFTVLTGSGTVISVRDSADCGALSDAWLSTWCRETVTFTPTSLSTTLPSNLHGPVWQAYVGQMDAAFAWSVLHADSAICSNPAVVAYVSAGLRTTAGAGACLAGLKQTEATLKIELTDPITNNSIAVALKPASGAPGN